MRPRVFPAEDAPAQSMAEPTSRRFNEAAGIPRGRHETVHHRNGDRAASMRPRVFPAEDHDGHRGDEGFGGASMRPRVFPAEDAPLGVSGGGTDVSCFNEAAGIPRGRRRAPVFPAGPDAGFNEAAGIPRGRRRRLVSTSWTCRASMRPRVFPAEDAGTQAARRRRARCFNEAAGIPREDSLARSTSAGTFVLQ